MHCACQVVQECQCPLRLCDKRLVVLDAALLERAEENSVKARCNAVESLDECMRQQGRRVALRVASVSKTVSKYFCIPGAKPNAINMWILVVRTFVNHEVN